MKILNVLLLTTVTVPMPVLAVQKCVTPSGDTIFTDRGCPGGSQPAGTITYESRPSSGLRPGEQRMLRRIEAKEAEERDAKRYGRERDARHHVSHGDRLKIRELEMEKSSLSKSLTRGSKSYGQTSAIRSQIRGIDRQIEQLRAPKW